MIRKIYETHILTQNLQKAITFYEKLGLTLAHYMEERNVAFFWIGDPSEKQQMLGVWEVTSERFRKNHFAFQISLKEMKSIFNWLKEKGITPKAEFGKEPIEPIVFSWMPAASIFFDDLDGNSLEFIALLPDKPQPEHDIMYLSEWEKLVQDS